MFYTNSLSESTYNISFFNYGEIIGNTSTFKRQQLKTKIMRFIDSHDDCRKYYGILILIFLWKSLKYTYCFEGGKNICINLQMLF